MASNAYHSALISRISGVEYKKCKEKSSKKEITGQLQNWKNFAISRALKRVSNNFTNREQDLSSFLALIHGRLWGCDRSG